MKEKIRSFSITMHGQKCGATFHDDNRCSAFQVHGGKAFYAEGSDLGSVFSCLSRQIARYAMRFERIRKW